jgi:uncharacterized damage-inducible protein DinB
MRSRILRPLLPGAAIAIALPLAFASPARADDAAATSTNASIKAEFNAMLTDAETKVVDLAEAVPADKYSWTPGKGVRSMSEVFMHVAGANYLIPTFVGQAPPGGIDARKLESTIKEKDQVVKTLRESFSSAHAAIDKTVDFDTMIDMFGQRVTKRYALLLLVTHAHEHLGQAIAYARSNAITPPWTARENAAAEAKAKTAGTEVKGSGTGEK